MPDKPVIQERDVLKRSKGRGKTLDACDHNVLETYKKTLERKTRYRSLGYDIDREREFILKQAGPVEGSLLEAGTGKGHFTLELAKTGHRFTTFDISPQEQEAAKLYLAYFGLDKQVDFRIEDGERTSFRSGSFDIVFSVNVIHHLKDPYRVVDELVRVLSPGGRLVLADFTEEGFKTMDKIHSLEGQQHAVGRLTLSDIEKYLVKKGFAVTSTKSEYQRVLVARRCRGDA